VRVIVVQRGVDPVSRDGGLEDPPRPSSEAEERQLAEGSGVVGAERASRRAERRSWPAAADARCV
jgi:hypothetical protein